MLAIVEGLYPLSDWQGCILLFTMTNSNCWHLRRRMTSACPSLRPNAYCGPYNTSSTDTHRVIRVGPFYCSRLPVNTMPPFPLHITRNNHTAVVEDSIHRRLISRIQLKQSRACIECHSKDLKRIAQGVFASSFILKSNPFGSDTPRLFFKPWSTYWIW